MIRKILDSFSITLRITLWYSIFVVILITGIFLLAFSISEKIAENISKRELMKEVNEITLNPGEFEIFDDGVFFIKYDARGNKIAGEDLQGFNNSLPLQENRINFYKQGNKKHYYYDMRNFQGEWIRGIVIINTDTQETGILLLTISVLSPLLLLIIIYGGYKIIKNSLSPIEKISDTAYEIQRNKDFSKRIEIGEKKDEIHKMAITFNEMLDSLENMYLNEKNFSSDVSHELRTPVSVILTESQYALNYSVDMDEAAESFGIINRQARRMTELINQIMEFSKIERAGSEKFEKINFSDIIEKILTDYRYTLYEKRIKLFADIRENLCITGNRVMLERLFDNLLSNAEKFTKDEIRVALYPRNGKCVLKIRDNGIGISEEEKNLIWNRFYQSDYSRNKDENKGFGVGLALVSKIAERHRASIGLKSELNKGSTFTVEFPLRISKT